MNLIAKFIAVGAVSSTAMMAEAQANPFTPTPLPPLTLEEQETLQTYQARKRCVEDRTPAVIREREEFEDMLEIRDNYIRTRAAELARQRSEASMHITLSGALSENLSNEETEQLVRTLRIQDEATLRKELNTLVKKPAAPQDPADYCAVKLNIDGNNFGRRVRALTEKHGMTILQTPEIR